MQLRVLGSVEVIGAQGRPCALEPRQARLLAMLLAAANRPVAREQLVETIWEDDPPATAARQLKNLVWSLRHRLTEAGVTTVTISSAGPGYAARVDETQLDSLVFARLFELARSDMDDGRHAAAAERLRKALELWRGPALAGVSGNAVEAVARRLNEQRLSAHELCLDIELRMGRRDVIAELTELVAENPLRERLVALLMRALHQRGRQADALDTFQKLRVRLAEELGIDPSPQLQAEHTAILRQSLPKPAESVRHGVIPRQLPPPVRHFVGRKTELKDLARLASEASAGAPVIISAIGGTGGVGKTALALHWAHQIREQFPDGQLYLNLHGFDPTGSPTPPADAIRTMLDAFQVMPQHIPAGLEAQVGLYRSLTASRRMLILLDNARDTDQVRPLLPSSVGCLVKRWNDMVTSRNQLTGLIADGAHPIQLDLLNATEARDLLTRHLGPERVAAESIAVDQLIDYCARLPLALAIVAARAAARPSLPLTAIADELSHLQRRLDTLNGGDRANQVRAAFTWSYQQLTAPAARLFRLCGLHPGPEISTLAAASLAHMSAEETQRTLAELTHTNLLSEPAPGRFRLHDLLRAYASEQTHRHDSAGIRRKALHRLLDHYLHTSHAAQQQLRPFQLGLADPAPGVIVRQVRDLAEARAWFETEHQGLLAAVELAEASRMDTQVWQLAWSIQVFLDRKGLWHAFSSVARAGLAATQRLCDLKHEAEFHRALGAALLNVRRFDDAHRELEAALDQFRDLGDLAQQARTYAQLTNWCLEFDDPEGALRHALVARDLYRTAGDRRGLASMENHVGWSFAKAGRYDEAKVHCERAIVLLEEVGDVHGLATAWDSLGFALQGLGDYRRAIECFHRSLEVLRRFGSHYLQAETLSHLGDAYHSAGDVKSAREAWQAALTFFRDLGHPDAQKVQERLR